MQTTTVAFLGLGLMGKPMACRLHAAGYRVVIWNRTIEKAHALASASPGIVVATTPALAVVTADIVITMLENGAVVQQVVDAMVAALPAGALLIDMSSTRQSEALALHRQLAAQQVACLDAPVSGGVLGAEAGTLAIMAGGAAEDFLRAQPFLAVLGNATHVGGPGAGQVAKLCNQLIVGGTLNIIAEALLLAQAAGADPVAVRAALRGGFAESRILEVHGQRMLARDFLPGGQIKSQAKDLDNVLFAAHDANLRLPVAELVRANYQRMLESLPHADQSAVLLAVEQDNPGIRLGTAPDRLPPS